ncbi:GH18908 [Drosophila grimshawi]|uniref:GH18908 n=2 Tax=Drosophila grimshawi TaxID=7222 RepID=B4JGU8_DROGR|nr:GH18908 [Drosophila grimshawi]
MLLYTKELVAPRAQFRRGLLRFKRHPVREKYGRMVCHLFAHSTIHGMQHVSAERRPRVRFFWLMVVLLATISFLVMFSVLDHHHNEQQLVSIVETTQLPVYKIEFPAVAICPWNHVNWLRASRAAERFLPHNTDAYAREAFHQLLIGMEQMTFGKFESLAEVSKRNLSSLAHLSIRKLASYLAYRCDELFEPGSCIFDETSYDCCDLFVPEYTENGQCLVFNSLISENSRKKKLFNEFYPLKLSTAGEGSGLQFVLRMNDSFLRAGTEVPFAMNLMIKEPNEWSPHKRYHLYSNTENLVSIDPMMVQTSTNTNKMHPKKRRCYFDNERNPNFPLTDMPYSRSNCIAACLQSSVLYHCRCTMPLFLPSIGYTRECSVLDFPCLYSHRDVFGYVKVDDQELYINDSRRGQFCMCPHSCNTKSYYTYLNVRQFIQPNTTERRQRRISADIYYGRRVLTKIVTRLQYTFHDWVASFGGILGLYVGASALSFAELAHVLGQLLWSLFEDLCASFKTNKLRVNNI